jgi:thiol-disulfide isomerase/thioredoxin
MYRGRFFLLAFLLLILALPVAYAIDSAPDVDEAINTRKVVVLYFLSDGCVPCESVTPIMDELKVTYAGSIHVFKLNTAKVKQHFVRGMGL